MLTYPGDIQINILLLILLYLLIYLYVPMHSSVYGLFAICCKRVFWVPDVSDMTIQKEELFPMDFTISLFLTFPLFLLVLIDLL